MNRVKFLFYFLICFCFLGTSCSFNTGKTGSIGIIVPKNEAEAERADEARNLVPDVNPLPIEARYPQLYSIKLIRSNGKEVDKTCKAGEKVFIKDLVIGDYEILMEGIAGDKLFSGKTKVTVEEGKTSKAEIIFNVSDIKTGNTMTLAQAIDAITTHDVGLLSLSINDVNNSNISQLKDAVYDARLNATISLDLSSSSGLTVSGDFSGCDKLTKIVYPDSVTTIGNAAFSNCSELREIVFGNNLTRIETQAFMNCSGLSSINLSTVINIGNKAFQGCSGLTSIDLSNVSEIGAMAFMDSGLNSATGLMGLWNIKGAIQDLTIMSATQVAILLKDTAITTPWTKQQ